MQEENIKNSKSQVKIDEAVAKSTLSEFSDSVVTLSGKNRLYSKNETVLVHITNLFNNLFMESKAYIGVAVVVVTLLVTLGLFWQKGGYVSNNSTVAETTAISNEVDSISQTVEDVTKELEDVEKDLEQMESLLSMADIDAAMKEIDTLK